MMSMAERIRQAISYSEAGFAIFKLKGKKPIAKQWQNSKYLMPDEVEDYLEGWDGNFGVVLSDQDLVIDIDPRNFGCKACSQIKKLCECKKFIKDDPHVRLAKDTGIRFKDYGAVVETGGGGLHIYMRLPKNVRIKERLKKIYGLGIEFKSKGRYVVGVFLHTPRNRETICT